jgi:hypothetical protein
MDFIQSRYGDAQGVTTGMMTLLPSKVAIFHYTAKDQSIHIHLIYDYDQSEMILYLHKIEL